MPLWLPFAAIDAELLDMTAYFLRQGRVFLCLLAGVTLVAMNASASAPAQVAATMPVPNPVVTHHSGTFNGIHVDYSAVVEGIVVPRQETPGGARLVSFSYLRDNPSNPATRPVVFLFNGGPITASIWIHLGAFGPKRVKAPEDLSKGADAFRLVDNPSSLLDVADLVFIDPADTGFSRRLPGTPEDAYHSIASDGQQVAGFMQRWLALHGRLNAPVYIVGESYGTIRAPEVISQLAHQPHQIQINGLFLLGEAVNIVEYAQRPNNITSYAVSLPTLAAIAWYHAKVDRSGKTFEQFVEEARRYGGNDYLIALFQGSDLPAAKRNEVARQLEKFSGISASYYLAHDLKISKEQFRVELLKDKHLLLGRNDGRYVAALTDSGAAPDPSDTIPEAFTSIWASYLRTELEVTSDQPYIPMAEVKGLEDWGWGASSPFSAYAYGDAITKLMQRNPRFRVLIGEGYYDTQTTIGASDYLRKQSGWPADRVALRFYQGGHMAYSVDRSAVRIASDLRALVTSAPMMSLPEDEQ